MRFLYAYYAAVLGAVVVGSIVLAISFLRLGEIGNVLLLLVAVSVYAVPAVFVLGALGFELLTRLRAEYWVAYGVLGAALGVLGVAPFTGGSLRVWESPQLAGLLAGMSAALTFRAVYGRRDAAA
jgi:hypothetical protein